MTVPQEAITAAAEVLGHVLFHQEAPDAEDFQLASAVLAAAAPHIVAAERERIRQLAIENLAALPLGRRISDLIVARLAGALEEPRP